MKPDDIDVTTDPHTFDQAFRGCFGETLAQMSEVMLARASHEAGEGFTNSASQTAQQAVAFSRWASTDVHHYACGFAAQLLIDLGQVDSAISACFEVMEETDSEIRDRLFHNLNWLDHEAELAMR